MAGTLPPTTSDLSLMPRSGYSVPPTEAELATRHIADQLYEAKRRQQIKAGATTQLVAYYNQIAHDHPEFEIIFVSADKSADGMATYMRETGMPWPGIEYRKRASVPALQKYAGKGIPDLVIVDASGKVLADSFVSGKYVGPAKVLDDLSTIFARSNAPQVAANR